MIKRTIPLLLLAGLLSLVLAACGSESATSTQPASPSAVPRAPSEEPANGDATGGDQATGTEVFVSLQDPPGTGSYAFDPEDFTFSVGETVTLVMESEAEFHTFTIEDLNININVPGGVTEKLTVTFDTAGTYTLICIPHQTLGMVGTVTVQ